MTSALWVPLGIAVAFAIFRLLLPAKRMPATTAPLPELTRRYQKWEIASIVPIVGFTALLAFGWFVVLRGLGRLIVKRSDAVYVLAPDDAYWLIPALFLGMVSSTLPTMALFKRLLGSQYAEYEAYNLQRAGFDVKRVFQGMVILVAIGAAAFVLGGVNYAVVFDQRGMTTQRLWGSVGGFRDYAAIAAIKAEAYFTAPNGNRVPMRHYVITFADGARWTTRDALRTPQDSGDAEILRFVAERSGRPIDLSGLQ